MDVMLLREVVTVVSFLAFAGVVAYALLPGNGARFEKAARIPMDDDETTLTPTLSQGRGRNHE